MPLHVMTLASETGPTSPPQTRLKSDTTSSVNVLYVAPNGQTVWSAERAMTSMCRPSCEPYFRSEYMCTQRLSASLLLRMRTLSSRVVGRHVVGE